MAESYIYRDENGSPVYRVIRSSGKRFHQERYSDGEWNRGVRGVQKVLYNLPAVADAARRGKVVYITEGEADADALISRGVIATTNPGGAGKWRDEYSYMLAGVRYAVVCWDNDMPDPKTAKLAGQEHALQIERSLRSVGVPVRFRRAKFGKDVRDHLEAGYSVDELVNERPGHPLPLSTAATEPTTASAQNGSATLPAALQLALRNLADHAAARGLPAPRPWGDGRDGWEACCPAHDDGRPSLSIRRGDKQPVVVTCHAGCTHREVAQALGMDPRDFSARSAEAGVHWEVLGVADAVSIAEEPLDEVVPQLLAAREKVVVAGPPKQLKTWLALHLARCVTCGEPVFGDELWTPEPQPVLFVQEEGARQRWAKRIVRTFEDRTEAPFRYVHRARFSLMDGEHVKRAAATAVEMQARVIVIDPWQRVTPGVKENDATESGPAWDAIHSLAAETGAAIVVLHHSRKDADLSVDALRGSSRMAGDPNRLLFATPSGHPVRHLNFLRREWRKVVDELWPEGHRLHGLRFHDLRHTCASLSLAATGNLHVVKERLGHEDIKTTVNRYGHLLEAADVALADALGAMIADDAEAAADNVVDLRPAEEA